LNLLLAAKRDHYQIASTIVDRQPKGCLIPLLGSMTAKFLLLLAPLHRDDGAHIFGHFRGAARRGHWPDRVNP
jgi:hypothetical protein